MNAQSPHKGWYTLNTVFGLSSALPPLVGGGGGLVCESVGKADLARSPGSLLIFHSLAIRLRVLPALPSGRVRSGVSC